MNLTLILFMILGTLAIGSAIVTIASRHPVRSAMALVLHFFMLSGLYLTLNAQFIAAIQILVYAGAIMVLVVFVIMLLNLSNEEKLKLKLSSRYVLGWVFGSALAFLLMTLYITHSSLSQFNEETAAAIGTVNNLGNELFTNYIVPIELIGVLLTVTIVGALVLAKKKLEN